MSLKLYNMMTRQKETFTPLQPNKVLMYVCGPTVYDYIHIGNARPLVFFDVVRKYLSSLNYDVKYVVNFTDVDDKLIVKSEELGVSLYDVADEFIEAYFEDARGLRIQDADLHPRVTENIDGIIQFISELVKKGHAYEADGDVYFRTKSFARYGKLSQQNMDELQHGARVEFNERKENQADFVLWKKAKQGEVSWPSEWGEGRPGWHIECSTLVKTFLGTTIDIHGGGLDLQFPHHECEIAQSEALHDEPLANYWLHNGYIHMGNEHDKMSKSLGNVILVRELLERAKPEAIRFLMLATHYRSPLNFTEESLAQSAQSVARIANSVTNLRDRLQKELGSGGEAVGATSAARASETAASLDFAKLDAIERSYDDKMQDDFNTADAITALFDLVAETNRYLKHDVVEVAYLQRIEQLFEKIDDVLCILPVKSEELLDEEVEQLIAERNEARAQKNWARADAIRDTLEEQGIVLEDTPQGLRWRRK